MILHKNSDGRVWKEGHSAISCRKAWEAVFLLLFVFICANQWGFGLCLKSGFEDTCRWVFGRELSPMERGIQWISGWVEI